MLSYPLAGEAQYNAIVAIQPFTVQTANYAPLPLNTTGHASGFYLVEEKTSDGRSFLGLTDFTRAYGNIPESWTGYGTVLVNKPSPDMGTATQKAVGNYWAIVSGSPTVLVLSEAIATSYSLLVTGGSFRISMSGFYTPVLNWNATSAEIYTAFTGLSPSVPLINALNSFGGSVSGGTLSYGFNNATPHYGQITGDFTGLFPATTPSYSYSAGGGGGSTQSTTLAPSVVKLTATGHSLSSGQSCYLGASSFTLVTPQSVDGPNALQIAAGSVGAALRRYVRDYTEGSAWVRVRRKHDYYLPGVTAGITTPADIPVPIVRSDDSAFLLAIFAGGSGYVNWEASDLSRYRGNIYEQTITDLRVSDI